MLGPVPETWYWDPRVKAIVTILPAATFNDNATVTLNFQKSNSSSSSPATHTKGKRTQLVSACFNQAYVGGGRCLDCG